MPKADVLQLVSDLSLGQADQTVVGDLYDDLMLDIGRTQAWMASVAMIQSQNGVGTYTPQPEVTRILSAFFDEDHLSRVGLRELEDHEELWRDIRGRPIAINVEAETGKTFRLFPAPDVDGTVLAGGLGEITFAEAEFGGGVPLGTGFSRGTISLLYAARRTNFLAYMEFPIAFLLLQREYLRESDHRDEAFAAACATLHRIFMEMIRDGRSTG